MQSEFSPIQIGALLGMVLSFFLTRFLIDAHLGDAPDENRKIHKSTVSTGGGIAILAGFVGALAYLLNQTGFLDRGLINEFVIYSMLAAGLGLIDDIFVIGAKRRLFALALICLFAVYKDLWVHKIDLGFGVFIPLNIYFGVLGSAFWLIMMINVTNFMDGANGMALGSLSLSFLFLGALCYLNNDLNGAVLGLCLAAAGFGFLTFNVTKGNIFAGDVGSYFYGMAYGLLGLWAVKIGVSPFFVGLCALPLLGDSILTIFHRIRIGENILIAHKKHIYQLLINAKFSHAKVSSFYWLATLLCGIIAITILLNAANFAAISFFVISTITVISFHFFRKSINAINDKISKRQ